MTDQNKISLSELSSQVKKFCQVRDWDQFHSPKDLAIGLTTEAAELLDLFRFKSESEVSARMQESAFREKVSDELADVFFFVLRFSEKNGIDLSEALGHKMGKNEKKYPVETAKGSNRKYNDQ